MIRKVPTEAPLAVSPALFAPREAQDGPRREERRAVVAPLAEETFKFQFTATRSCRDKLRQAQDLLRHRIPDGDVGAVVEQALDLLIEQVKKTGMLEFDHLDGFARTRVHHIDRIRLACHAHNQHAAERMYGPRVHGTCARFAGDSDESLIGCPRN